MRKMLDNAVTAPAISPDVVPSIDHTALRTSRPMRFVGGCARPVQCVLAEETPLAIVYNGTTYAVMMATPADLEDFAIGFSLGEGIITSIREISEINVIQQVNGIELRIWLETLAIQRLAKRRRALLGATACGLCGVESLAAAVPNLPRIDASGFVAGSDVVAATSSISSAQTLNREARSLHAAGYWRRTDGLIALREDVGRHNALDKLAGALTQAEHDPAMGLIVLTSRVSVEMIQKAASLGAPVIAAMSAPTALALRAADAAGITLIAVARGDNFEVHTHLWRLCRGSAPSEPRATT